MTIEGNGGSRGYRWRVYRFVGGMRIGTLANVIYAFRESEDLNYLTAVVVNGCDLYP